MWRQKITLYLFIIIFSVIILRLFYWQIIMGNKLAQAASDQYYFKLTLPANRGNILSSDGNLLVTNKSSCLVYAEPKKIIDQKMFVSQIADILNLDKQLLNEKISDQNSVWVLIKHKVDQETCDLLQQQKIVGLGFEKESSRFYPEASMAAQLLGFVGSSDIGDYKGYFGVEGFYDQALKGRSGFLVQEKDAQGLPILLGSVQKINPENGQNLELNLDRAVQGILDRRLAEGMDKYGAKQGLVAVMDPFTGAILGVSSFPKYDQNNYSQFDPNLYPNPLVAETYEPGSTFKVLVMAAALNENILQPQDIYNETGPTQIGDYSIKTWNNQYSGKITMTQIIEKSSNPGMVYVGEKLGKQKLLNYLKNYGFGEKTGIDLEEESTYNLRPDDDWKEIDLATTCFGQGIAVTPIQMLRAIAVLANGGNLMEPQIVHKIIDTNGKTIEKQPKTIKEVISTKTSRAITDMMINAVDNGEAKWAKPKGYRIAGKTGTAQIPVAGHYDATKTIASFVGFAPADKPKFVMLVTLREPESSQWGSETAAPLFFTIAQDLFAYYGISPTN